MDDAVLDMANDQDQVKRASHLDQFQDHQYGL
jgi:hypothetical protein